MNNMQNLIDNSLEFIKENLQNKGKIFVAFSGGKDSIVIADLLKRSGLLYQLYHSYTGIDPPELTRFIRKNYPDCKFLKAKKTFWHLLTTKNPPANFSRWCCNELKKLPSQKVKIFHRVLGIRKEEGSRRSKYQEIEYFEKLGIFHYHPILNWKEGDVWEYIEEQGLVYPELYDLGLSRLGCVVCPFHSNKSGSGHSFYKKHWPRFFTLFEKKCKEWFKKRERQGKSMFFKNADEFIAEWYKGNVQWYKRE